MNKGLFSKCILVISSFVLVALSGTLVASASNDNIGFKFRIMTYQMNSNTAGRYRQTTNPDNKWKVNLLKSGEGKGTITTFFLENDFGLNLSKGHQVKQGSGNHYYSAYANASKKYIFLSAENNNWNNNSYMVSGNWDEETN